MILPSLACVGEGTFYRPYGGDGALIASVIRRHKRGGRTVALIKRFDSTYHDKVWSAPLPFLFQGRHGSTRRAISSATVLLHQIRWRRCLPE